MATSIPGVTIDIGVRIEGKTPIHHVLESTSIATGTTIMVLVPPPILAVRFFKGDSGFSEPETLALKTAMEKVNETKNLVMVIALHSFGQVLLYPYGWSTTVEAPNTPEMIEKGNIFANVSKISFGTIYTVQNSAVGYSLISGATDDWAKGVLRVKYSYTLELRDEGAQGFTLGTDKIAPTGQEIWEGFMALLYAIRPNKYIVP